MEPPLLLLIGSIGTDKKSPLFKPLPFQLSICSSETFNLCFQNQSSEKRLIEQRISRVLIIPFCSSATKLCFLMRFARDTFSIDDIITMLFYEQEKSTFFHFLVFCCEVLTSNCGHNAFQSNGSEI